MTDDDLAGLAVDLVLALMASASTDQIRPVDWWPRARAALETAAAASSGLRRMVSVMGRKLQIDGAMGERSAISVARMAETLAPPDIFARFRSLCQRDALFIVAAAQTRRAEQKGRA